MRPEHVTDNRQVISCDPFTIGSRVETMPSVPALLTFLLRDRHGTPASSCVRCIAVGADCTVAVRQ